MVALLAVMRKALVCVCLRMINTFPVTERGGYMKSKSRGRALQLDNLDLTRGTSV